jgi:hypothetical protein
MQCSEVEAKIIDYLDNTLEEGIRQEIEKHLETCEGCLDEVMDIRKVIKLISSEEMEKPEDSLRINFYHMLQGQIKKENQSMSMTTGKPITHLFSAGRYRFAAGIALLICGTFIGLFIHTGINYLRASDELKQLQSEVSDLKKNTIIAMLKEVSSSDRIQAVSYADDLEMPDRNIIEVLVKTLNHDKNVNVRMAAAYALAKFADQRAVCDSLVLSLSLQNDPILQVTLINILADRREKSALRSIQQIISNKSTIKEVRDVAENSLRVLM